MKRFVITSRQLNKQSSLDCKIPCLSSQLGKLSQMRRVNWHIKPATSLANYRETLRRLLSFDSVFSQVLRKEVCLLFPDVSASNRRKRLNHRANYLRFQFVIKVCAGTASAAVISKHFGERDKSALNQRYHRSPRLFANKKSQNVHQQAKIETKILNCINQVVYFRHENLENLQAAESQVVGKVVSINPSKNVFAVWLFRVLLIARPVSWKYN